MTPASWPGPPPPVPAMTTVPGPGAGGFPAGVPAGLRAARITSGPGAGGRGSVIPARDGRRPGPVPRRCRRPASSPPRTPAAEPPRPASSRPCDDRNPSRIPRPEDLAGPLTPASRAGNRADPALTRAPRLTQATAPPWRAQRRGQGQAPRPRHGTRPGPAGQPATANFPRRGRSLTRTPVTESNPSLRASAHVAAVMLDKLAAGSRLGAGQNGVFRVSYRLYRDSPDGVRRPAVPSDWARRRSPQHPTDRRYRRRPRPHQFLVDRGLASYNRGTSQLR